MMDADRVRDALQFIAPNERETWVRMGMAVKAELGDSGFDVWNTWSQGDESYKLSSARSVWRSIKAGGGITGATLFKAAIDRGWVDDGKRVERQVDEATLRRRADEARREEAERERAARAAVVKAQRMIDSARMEPHNYLASKGFPEHKALVMPSGAMIIPMRKDSIQGRAGPLVGGQVIELIDNQWVKKMIYGTRARGALLRLGVKETTESVLVEGLATGLTAVAAARRAGIRAAVYVAFTADNLAHIAGELSGRRYVLADHDASGTGQRVAERTGLPWAMSDQLGEDVNDLHQRRGLEAVADLLTACRFADAGGRAA